MKAKAKNRFLQCLWLLLLCSPGFNLAYAQSPLLVRAEYFYDTDPGLGNGSPISFTQDSIIDVNFQLDVSGLSPGFHKAYFRTKDENNMWSLTNVMNIYVEETQQIPAPEPLPDIVRVEYFLDTDPGEGNGISIPFTSDSIIDVNFEIGLTNTSHGFHKAYFRTKDENNVWSLTNVMNIYVEEVQQNPAPAPLPDIVQAEYFLDTDPGEGNGISIPFSSDSIIDVNFEIGLTNASPGFHKAYFRTKDENNLWSLTNVMNIYVADSVQPPPPLPNLTGMEYFFDTDPGFGQGYTVEVIPASMIDLVFAPDLTHLTQTGQHRLYARIKDENNVWSLVYNEPLLVNIIANFEANETEILQNGLVEFTDLSLGNATGWEWDFENDGMTDSYLQNPEWVFTEPGVYSVKLTVSDGINENTYIREDFITVIPIQDLTIPAGWSGISSFINPAAPAIETVLQEVMDELVIVTDLNGNQFWPEGGLNTIVSWDNQQGYWIKMNNTASLKLSGTRSLGSTLQLTEGWNLIPVWSLCEVPVTDLFNIPQTMIIKSAAGYQLYWPEKGINTLGNLMPGKAYLVKLSGDATIVFPECE